ncbi:MAG: hypothetical protein H6573_11255 [Lewinellaceae bacterium]|nr:hypothetical protein [Phaeodactylibacter sp.]MCB0613636.1 hypothetical protein [Phaeodactylibacter sp.]MCB9348068.1 hypothetical protein [Lewinellaceae bacterium]
MKRKLSLLVSVLLLTGIYSRERLSAQASELYGSYSVIQGTAEFIIDISAPDEQEGTRIAIEENAISLHRLSIIDVIGFLIGKIEPCAPGEACNFRRKRGVPYLFHELENSGLLPRGTFQVSTSCTSCSTGELKKATLGFLAERLSLDVEYTQVPTYMVCQDVPSFLAHFHSGENNFSNFKVRHLEYVGDYLEITHVTLGNAVGYLSQRTNSLFQFDPACRYYSRAYTKPFRILKEGSPEEIIADFAEKHFLKIEKIEGEYWDAIILRPQ